MIEKRKWEDEDHQCTTDGRQTARRAPGRDRSGVTNAAYQNQFGTTVTVLPPVKHIRCPRRSDMQREKGVTYSSFNRDTQDHW